MEKKVFRSRVSVLVVACILAIFSWPVISMVQDQAYQGLFFIGVVFLFGVILFFGMRYIISEDKLYLKIFWVVPYGNMNISDIISVERTYNPVSSCSASLKRLDIRVKRGSKRPLFLLVSPVREQDFFDTLKKRNPNINIHVTDKKTGYRFWDWDI